MSFALDEMKQVAHDSNSNITSEHAPHMGSLILYNQQNFIRDQLSMKSSIELTDNFNAM